MKERSDFGELLCFAFALACFALLFACALILFVHVLPCLMRDSVNHYKVREEDERLEEKCQR